MNHSETEIPIISGYLRLEYIIDDGWTVQLPSQTLLEEIVRFPKIDRRYPDPCDPFNVERYRIRDREADLDNQLFLLYKSNAIVDSIRSRLSNPSPMDLANIEFCDKNGIDYESFKYRQDLLYYVRTILQGTNPDIDNSSRLNNAFAEIISKNISNKEQFLREHHPEVWEDIHKLKLTDESHRRRFSEYKAACDWIECVTSQASVDRSLSAMLDTAIQMNTDNEKLKNSRRDRSSSKEDKKSKKGKGIKNKNSNSTSVDLEEGENLFVFVTDNNAVTAAIENSNVVITDSRILAQCLFCNRFHLQEPSRVVSRYCDRDECKKKKKAWLESLTPGRNDISIKDVSPSGF